MRLALQQAFALLDSQDAVAASRWRERTAFADFLPSVTPVYQRGEGRNVFGADLSQRVPGTGGTLTASGRYLSDPNQDAPFPRTTDLRLLLTQPLLRGVGPNASFFELRNARRTVQGQERSLRARAPAHRGRGGGGLLRGDRRSASCSRWRARAWSARKPC